MEQETLTAEERSWWVDRLNKQNQNDHDRMQKNSGSTLPPSPGRPPIDS